MRVGYFLWIGVMSMMILGCTETNSATVKSNITNALKTSVVLNGINKNAFSMTLTFQNISSHPLRIYYIDDPLFNKTMNTFYAVTKSAKKVFDQEEVPPHGMTVNEKDFYLIAPQSKKVFNVEVRLSVKNPQTLVWRYHNKITSWEAGTQTLDGKTKALFGSKKIPYIWTGSIESRTSIK